MYALRKGLNQSMVEKVGVQYWFTDWVNATSLFTNNGDLISLLVRKLGEGIDAKGGEHKV